MGKIEKMVNEDTVNLIMATDTFKTTAKVLSGNLNISYEDAKQELILEMYEHRLKQDITVVTDKELRDIIFSRKKIQERYYKDTNEVSENFVQLEDDEFENLGMEYQITNDTLVDDLSEQEFVDMLKCFQPQQREFVARLLLTGKEDTLSYFKLDEGHFNERVNRLIKYISKHRDKFKSNVKSNYIKEIESQIQDISYFMGLIENDIDPKYVGKFLEEHQEDVAFNNALDKVRYQVLLMKAWDKTIISRLEGYTFINSLLNEQETLKKLIMK